MEDQHILKIDEYSELEEGAIIQIYILEAMAGIFATCQQMLANMKNNPYYFEIFSSDERIQINLTERSVPEMIRSLRALKTSIIDGSWQGIEGEAFREKMQEINGNLEKIKCFTDEKLQKIPKSKPKIIFWLLYPVNMLSYHAHGITHQIRMRRAEKMGRKLEAERKEIAKKREELKK